MSKFRVYWKPVDVVFDALTGLHLRQYRCPVCGHIIKCYNDLMENFYCCNCGALNIEVID